MGTHTEAEWVALKIACGNRCLACGVSGNDTPLTKGHIIPVYKEGSSDKIDNIQPLCIKCSRSSVDVNYRNATSLTSGVTSAPTPTPSPNPKPKDLKPFAKTDEKNSVSAGMVGNCAELTFVEKTVATSLVVEVASARNGLVVAASPAYEVAQEEKTVAPPVLPAKIGFDFTTGKFTGISLTGPHMAAWVEAYPAVDVTQQLREAASWLVSNPKNRKSEYPRFINLWLKKAQDRAPGSNGPSRPAYGGTALPISTSPTGAAAERVNEKNRETIAKA